MWSRLFRYDVFIRHALSQLLLPPVLAQTILACMLALLIYTLESSAASVKHSDQLIALMNKLTRLMIDEQTGSGISAYRTQAVPGAL